MEGSVQPSEGDRTLSSDEQKKRSEARLWRWMREKPVPLSLLIYTAIIIATTIPTADVYMWWGHFMLFPVFDVCEICKVWSAEGFGHVPWFPDCCFGYGYPFLTFYAPLGFYVAAIFHFIFALDYGPATKLGFYTSIYLSGLLMYAFVYTIGSRTLASPSLVGISAASVLYLTRYHLTDVFVRDVMGESWAGPPCRATGGWKLPDPALAGNSASQLNVCGLLLSHNITALWGGLSSRSIRC
jgi:hypothetical protein